MQEKKEERGFVAAVIQIESRRRLPWADFSALVMRLIEKAASCGSSLIVLPEMFAGPHDRTEVLFSGCLQDFLSRAAAHCGCWLVGGSLSTESGQGKPYNTLPLYDPHGRCVYFYHKRHLFHSHLPGAVANESNRFSAGPVFPAPYQSSLGRLGFAVCYDLRFPELFVAQKADLFVVPSAFRDRTGRDHWEILLRARAIENQSFILAANYSGRSGHGRFWGHSMIIDPWGRLLNSCPENGDAVATAFIDLTLLSETRLALPMRTNS